MRCTNLLDVAETQDALTFGKGEELIRQEEVEAERQRIAAEKAEKAE
jgi:hypothetical protein